MGLGKTGTPSNKKGRQAGRAARRQTKPREGGHTIQQMETRRRQGETRPRDTPSNKGKQEGVEWETKGDKTLREADTADKALGRRTHYPAKGNLEGDKGNNTSGRRIHHPTNETRRETMGDNGRQGLGKTGTPSNKKGRQAGRAARRQTKPREGGHTIQQMETRRRQGETRPRDTPSNKGKQEGVEWETKGDKTLREADTPSNKGKQEGRQWETGGGKTSGRQTHHPRKGNEKGEKLETRRDKASGRKDWEGLGRTGKDWQKKMGKTRKDWERVGRTVKDQEGLRKDWDRSWKGRTGKE